MSSASPSNSMNPFALTDEEEDTSFPSSSTNLRSSYQGHRKGLTSGSDPHPDGLPSRIGSATTAPDRKSAEDDDVGMSGKNPAESYDDNEPPESLLFGLAADSCADISPGRLPNSRSIVDDSTPADSDIPTIDPESRAATAEQSMYMSYRPSSSANSQPVQSSSTSTVRSDTKKGANLGSSSTSTSHDFSRRTGQQQGIGKPAMDRKGKGKAQLNNSTETLLNLVSSDVRDKADRGRISDVNHPVHNVAPSRANSASPPPDLLISPSSVSSIGLSTKPHHSIPRDAAAEKRNLLPLPVTTPHTIAGNRMEGSSMVGHVLGSSSTGDVIFDANGEHRKEKKRSSTKSRTERHHHRHSKRHHKHSRAMEYEDNDREEDGEQYSNDDAGGYDQRTMIMSSLSNRNESRTGKHKRSRKRVDPTAGLSEREKALWVWANVTDLDGYLQEVYEYYIGKGVYCIALRRVLNLLTSAFVIIFSTFLLSCIDVSRFPRDGHGQLKDVVVQHCTSRWSFPHKVLTWIVCLFFGWRMVTFAFGIRHLLEIKRFYEHLLNIPNSDIQTIAWGEVVARIGSIRQENALTSVRNQDDDSLAELQDVPKLDAHDVANRIMRQENYLIALFTKDLLDLRVRLPMPLALKRYIPQRLVTCGADGESIYLTFGANSLTKALEWNLRYCLLGFIFDERGRVRKEFVKDRGRQGMIESLRHRFMFMGILNAIFSPFIVLYLLMYSFFRYFEEYHKNPSAIGSRGYTPFARWKFREFNELPHIFERRLDESYPAAKQYVDQFPKEITAITMRFVAFISGAFAAVLLLLSVVDPVFLHFEITPDRTVLFYLGVFTSILAVSRGMVPANNQVFDPELLLTEVVGYVHYMPESWEGKLHSQQVHAEFSKMFQMKLAIFAQEITSVILTPLVLLFSLPACAGKIIDFCGEFTVHVSGIGYVCSFAVFDFKREGNVKVDQVEGSTDTYSASRLIDRESKMEQSFLHFKITNPEWQPSDPATSMLLSRIADGDTKAAATLRNSARPRRSLTQMGLPASSRLASLANEHPSTGTDDERLKQKSQLYETALQRSIMLKGSNAGIKAATSSRSSRLQPMEERPEAEEEDGWETARLGALPRDADMQDSAEADHGAGMLGLLHQVIKK